jgi:2-polyprenyl-3-methyl-5-hydroxy-6-metoxy-1,4-benzoquinol methylase
MHLAVGEHHDTHLALHDPRLDRWLPLIERSASGRPVLEMGCGAGGDTATLAKAGFTAVAFDNAAASGVTMRTLVLEARTGC